MVKRVKVKKRNGRPSKKDTLDLKQLERLASLGLTDVQLGVAFDVDERTITRWKKDSNVMSALKKGKGVADQKVENSLYQRACGYSHPEDKFFQHEGEIITQATIKHYPPDTTACIFWLKNRQRENWRDRQEIEFVKPFLHKEFEGKTKEELEKQADELRAKRLNGIKTGTGTSVPEKSQPA